MPTACFASSTMSTHREPIDHYFPLEAETEEQFPFEYSFRAHLIFKLLGYDF